MFTDFVYMIDMNYILRSQIILIIVLNEGVIFSLPFMSV